jgi:hypothetical protein
VKEKSMQCAIPRFNSDFLNDIVEAFQRRSRAISYHGPLETCELDDDGTHCLEIVCRALASPVIILVITPSVASLYLRHSGNRQRGKILLRLENMVLVPNCRQIVNAFEQTIFQAHQMTPPNAYGPALDAIRAIWSNLVLSHE